MTDVREETTARLNDASELAGALPTLVETDHKQEARHSTTAHLSRGRLANSSITTSSLRRALGTGSRTGTPSAWRSGMSNPQTATTPQAGSRPYMSRLDVPRRESLVV